MRNERGQVDLSRSVTPWSAGMKARRLVWEIVRPLFFRLTPKWLFWRWRRFLLVLFGARLGEGVKIHPSARVLMPWNLVCGSNVVIGADVDVYNFCPITIGDNAMVSQRTFLCTGSHDPTDPHLPLIFSPIEIGAQAWVASECFVGPGRRIGEGAVIAARSVVTKDMPDWMICAGHPCKPIKERTLTGQSRAGERHYA